MGKIMGLDVGAKTIGVAFCEEGTRLAFPGKTLWRQEGKKRDMAALRQLVADNDVKRIVVGIPLLSDGSRGPQAETIEAFIATLRNSVRIPIVTQDEHLSTQEAEQLLFAANRPRAEHKRTLDSVAAALILQWHLEEEEEKRRKGEEERKQGQGDNTVGTQHVLSEAHVVSNATDYQSPMDSSFILHPSSFAGVADV